MDLRTIQYTVQRLQNMERDELNKAKGNNAGRHLIRAEAYREAAKSFYSYIEDMD